MAALKTSVFIAIPIITLLTTIVIFLSPDMNKAGTVQFLYKVEEREGQTSSHPTDSTLRVKMAGLETELRNMTEPTHWDTVKELLKSKRLGGLPITQQAFNSSLKNPCWKESEKGREVHCLPYFFLGGFAKSGTTELYYKLIWHPEITPAKRKENFWWSKSPQKNPENKPNSYTRYFNKAVPDLVADHRSITLDASASTIWHNGKLFPPFDDVKEQSPDPPFLMSHLIHRQLPDARCVVIIRNPVTRLYSDYLYFGKRSTKSPRLFHAWAKSAVDMFNECVDDPKRSFLHCAYAPSETQALSRLRIGLYYVHLHAWLAAFPADRLMVVRLEEYTKNTAAVLQKVYAFLKVSYVRKEAIEKYLMKSKASNVNKKSYKKYGPMLSETYDLLSTFYQPFNEKLATLTGDEGFLYKD